MDEKMSKVKAMPWLSIVIPTYNEKGQIGALIEALRDLGAELPAVEIVVSDGGSTDGTATEATAAGGRVINSPRKGRAAQLNYGAAQSAAPLIYFLHADSLPPPTLLADLRQTLADGTDSGCYRLQFDDSHWFLRASCWFTRFDINAFRFGDQSLFVRRAIFEQAGGYDESLIVFEDQEIITRLKCHGQFRILPGEVTTSARKYRENGVFKLQFTFTLLCVLYQAGFSQKKLVNIYKKLIKQHKV